MLLVSASTRSNQTIVAKTFWLAEAADTLRYLVEDRPWLNSPHNLRGIDQERGFPDFFHQSVQQNGIFGVCVWQRLHRSR
jgi:hypothetical protein